MPTRVNNLTALALAVEIGDWHPFTGSTIGSFMGRVSSAYFRAPWRVQGSITKTGNTHVRGPLGEAAWPPHVVGETMRDALERPRRPPAPEVLLGTGDARGMEHLRDRKSAMWSPTSRSRRAGWCWSLALLEQ